MKPWMKILMWLGLGGGIGFFAGYQVGQKVNDKVRDEELQECSKGYREQCDNCEDRKEAKAARAQREYSGEDGAPTDDDPEMPEEEPKIGDEELVESGSVMVEFLTEEDYYDNLSGIDQEELIFYTEDEVLFNKNTNSKLTNDEIQKAFGCQTVSDFSMIYFGNDKCDSCFVLNHLIPMEFRIDRMDAAYIDDHDDYEEEDG